MSHVPLPRSVSHTGFRELSSITSPSIWRSSHLKENIPLIVNRGDRHGHASDKALTASMATCKHSHPVFLGQVVVAPKCQYHAVFGNTVGFWAVGKLASGSKCSAEYHIQLFPLLEWDSLCVGPHVQFVAPFQTRHLKARHFLSLPFRPIIK